MANAEVVAVGMLTHRDLEALGPTFNWAWPVEEAPISWSYWERSTKPTSSSSTSKTQNRVIRATSCLLGVRTGTASQSKGA